MRRLIIALAALLAAVLISGAIYVATVDPLRTGNVGVGANAAADMKGSSVSYHPHAEVYVATTIHNSGVLPVKIEGLAPLPGRNFTGYYPAELRQGNGADAGPGRGRPFVPFWLWPGRDQGILITYRAVTDCSSLLKHVQHGSGASFGEVRLRFSFLAIHRTQAVELTGREPGFSIRLPSRAECLREQRQS